MKQYIIDSLVGKTVKQAEEIVKDAGYKSWALPKDSMVTAIARPNTVMIYFNDKFIVDASSASDPFEITQ